MSRVATTPTPFDDVIDQVFPPAGRRGGTAGMGGTPFDDVIGDVFGEPGNRISDTGGRYATREDAPPPPPPSIGLAPPEGSEHNPTALLADAMTPVGLRGRALSPAADAGPMGPVMPPGVAQARARQAIDESWRPAPPGPSGLAGFGRNLARSVAEVTPSVGAPGEWAQREMQEEPGTGFGGAAGSIVGTVGQLGAAAAVGPEALIPMIGARTAGAFQRRSEAGEGPLPNAAKTAIDLALNFIPVGLAGNISGPLAHAIAAGDRGGLRLVLTEAAKAAGTGAGASELGLIADNIIDVASGRQTTDQAWEQIKAATPATLAAGAAAPVAIGGIHGAMGGMQIRGAMEGSARGASDQDLNALHVSVSRAGGIPDATRQGVLRIIEAEMDRRAAPLDEEAGRRESGTRMAPDADVPPAAALPGAIPAPAAGPGRGRGAPPSPGAAPAAPPLAEPPTPDLAAIDQEITAGRPNPKRDAGVYVAEVYDSGVFDPQTMMGPLRQELQQRFGLTGTQALRITRSMADRIQGPPEPGAGIRSIDDAGQGWGAVQAQQMVDESGAGEGRPGPPEPFPGSPPPPEVDESGAIPTV